MTQDSGLLPARSAASQRRPPRGRWIVCEPTDRWAIALRREAGAEGPRLFETRSLPDAWSMLERFPASFLVTELTLTGRSTLWDWMVETARVFPMTRVAVVADRAWRDWEWLAREAGAVWFAASPREVRPLVAIARRHLCLVPPTADFVEEVWDRLPWKPANEQ